MKFNPETEVPDLSGKIIFITGGTSGVGQETIIHLARHNPAHIYFTGRSAPGASTTRDRVSATSSTTKLTFIEMDQSSLHSAKSAITTHFKHPTLDILITNAGMTSEIPALSKDGYELAFATNHLAHALAIKLLLPALLRRAQDPAADVRIVQLASTAAYNASGIDFATLRTEQKRYVAGGLMRYSQSKLANTVYAAELARRFPNILSVSLHPGLVDTPILNDAATVLKVLLSLITFFGNAIIPLLTPEEGAYNSLWAATRERGMVKSGAYYEPVGVEKKASKAMADGQLATRLWEWTEKELEGT